MKNKSIFFLLALLLIAALFACSKETTESYWPTVDWRVTNPEKVGISSKVLSKLDTIQGIYPEIASIIVVRKGYVVYEKYYIGKAEELRSVYSVTKSVISSLIGIAIEQGLIQGPDQKLIEFFPENTILKSDPVATTVTLRHLLTMSDGIRESGNMIELYLSDPKYSKKLTVQPGSYFKYNNMSAQIASLILTIVTKKTASDYAMEKLFNPLGIKDFSWRKLIIDNTTTNNGSHGLLLTTRDMAKFGYLYLKKGRWEGKELVSENWIAESTKGQIKTSEASSYIQDYGYFWWITKLDQKPAYTALGWGGQAICVLPDQDLVAVVTSKSNAEGKEPSYIELIDKYIAVAIKK